MNFTYKNAKFHFENVDFTMKTTDDTIVVLKPEGFLNSYDPYFALCPSKNVLELGVFEGGSLIYQALRHPDFKFVGIDIRKKSDVVLEHIKRLGLEEQIKIYYEVSQDDEQAIKQIVNDNFGSAGFDLVSDDASHFYQLSKSSFEITFPMLNPNGFYILEDWAWAHWAGYQAGPWADKAALTNLVFELTMLLPSCPGLIKEINVYSSYVVTRKGVYSGERMDINSMIKKRGVELKLI